MTSYREARACWERGLAHQLDGNWDTALACFDEFLTHQPDNPAGLSNKAHCLMNLSRLDEAMQCCEHALYVAPYFARACAIRGLVLARMGHIDDALLSLEKAQRLGLAGAADDIRKLQQAIDSEVGQTGPAPVLGYHEIGDFHYFTALPETSKWMGMHESETFHTADSFLSLIIAVHETYHIMQDLFLGSCCWVSARRDNIAASAVAGKYRDGSLEENYLALPGNDITADRLLYSSEFASLLLGWEMQRYPQLKEVFTPYVDLTSQDLLECHAAILTELYIANLLQARPQAFNERVVQDLAGCFRVSLMDRYSLPLKMFRDLTGRFWNWDRTNSDHPLYSQCRHAAEYTMVAFLLDFALHIPPRRSLESAGTSSFGSVVQDALPPCRYGKLVLAIVPYFIEGRRRGAELNLDAAFLYSSMSTKLARTINVGNWMALAENQKTIRTVPEIHTLLHLPKDEIMKALNLETAPETFLDFDAASSAWLDVHRGNPFRTLFPRLYGSREKALKCRLSVPRVFFTLHPKVFYPTVDIPGFYRTPEGVYMMPPVTLTSGTGAKPDARELPELPYEFIDQVVSHEITLNLAGALLRREPLRCPLATQRLEFYACAGRTGCCKKITNLGDLPQRSECLARRILETVFDHHEQEGSA